MKYPYFLLLIAAFMAACTGDDSDHFLAKPKDMDYSSDKENSSSSSAWSSSDDDEWNPYSSEEFSSSSYSSSSMRSSSSYWLDTVPYVPPCRDEYEDNCRYGVLVDNRDGQTYRTVEIGSQIWMAENLNYVSENSECYEDDLSLCDVYGRLYKWVDAIEVCPSGWHLPTLNEWKILFTYAGGIETAAPKLRATDGWSRSDSKGTDDYGFSVLPAGGYRNLYNGFRYLHEVGYFWTATDYGGDAASVYNMCFDERPGLIDGFGWKSDNTFSVRCIKD